MWSVTKDFHLNAKNFNWKTYCWWKEWWHKKCTVGSSSSLLQMLHFVPVNSVALKKYIFSILISYHKPNL